MDIRELVYLAMEFDLTYNIHLPVDVSLTDISKLKRDQAVEMIRRVIDLLSPLEPSTHTLHLDYQGLDDDTDWYKRGFYWEYWR